jgi:phage major head subunit gpT-like protein
MAIPQIEGVDAGKLAEVHTTFKAFLFHVLGQNPRWTQSLSVTDVIPTKGKIAKIKMAERTFGVHEWLDERQKAKIAHFDHSIEIKKWANALELKVDDLADEDMNLGEYRIIIGEMADDFVEHKHQLLIDLLNNGFTGAIALGYDGQYFIDTDHPLLDGSVQSNKGTAAFSDTALYAGIKQMVKMKRPNGQLANIQPTHGVFPEALRATVEGVLNKRTVANGSDNPLYKRIEPIFDPRLDAVSETAWYLKDLGKMAKPFYWGNRAEVTPDYSNANEFETDRVAWGAKARYNAAYGQYQTVYGSTGAG